MVERNQAELSIEYFKNFVLENQEEVAEYFEQSVEVLLKENAEGSSFESLEEAALKYFQRFVLTNEEQVAEYFKQSPEKVMMHNEVIIRLINSPGDKNKDARSLDSHKKLINLKPNDREVQFKQHNSLKFSHEYNEFSQVFITANGIKNNVEMSEEYLEVCVGNIVYIRESPTNYPKTSVAILEEAIESESIYKIENYYLLTLVQQDQLTLTLYSSADLNSKIEEFVCQGYYNRSFISFNKGPARDSIRIGRHPTCEVVIDCNTISSFHLLISYNGSFIIKDNKSKNKTYRLLHTYSTISGNNPSKTFNIQSSERVAFLDSIYEITKKIKN